MLFLPLILLISSLLTPKCAWTQASQSISELHRSFANPPDSSRIMMRWWWFGPAAANAEITRELEQMKAAGIGGVEIANLYPLALDDPQTGFHNTPFLSSGSSGRAALRRSGSPPSRPARRCDFVQRLAIWWPAHSSH
jgi:hypothetical protein